MGYGLITPVGLKKQKMESKRGGRGCLHISAWERVARLSLDQLLGKRYFCSDCNCLVVLTEG
jgi:hypothetical protein